MYFPLGLGMVFMVRISIDAQKDYSARSRYVGVLQGAHERSKATIDFAKTWGPIQLGLARVPN